MSVLTDGIFAKLTAVQTAGSFYDDLGGRINGIQAAQDVALPNCVFTVLNDSPINYFDAGADIDTVIQIDLWGSIDAGYDALSDINDKLITLLDRQSITITGYTAGQALNVSLGLPTVEEDAIRILSQWRVWACS